MIPDVLPIAKSVALHFLILQVKTAAAATNTL